MSLARFLVCEKTGQWAVALRREMTAEPLRVVETRSLSECGEEVKRSPASFVAVEATSANAAQAADWIERLRREFPQVRVVVLARREAQAWEEYLREAGAVAFISSPRSLRSIVRMARRCLAAAPAEELTQREEIWTRLPWKHALRENTRWPA